MHWGLDSRGRGNACHKIEEEVIGLGALLHDALGCLAGKGSASIQNGPEAAGGDRVEVGESVVGSLCLIRRVPRTLQWRSL